MDRTEQRLSNSDKPIGIWQSLLLLVLALPLGVILVLALTISGYLLFTQLVPAASAKAFVAELNTSVRLELFWVLDVRNSSGRYLVIDSPKGRISGNIAGFDWAHWSRTSLYLTEDRKIAVLGVVYSDYIIDPSNLTIENLAGSVASDGWTYLGAFDGGLDLKFIPATAQRECNPTRMSEETPLLQGAARQQSRHASCSQQELAW